MSSVSPRQALRNAVLNRSLSQWLRAVDLILEHYLSSSDNFDDEARDITRQALILMCSLYFEKEEVVLLMDSDKLKLPKSLEESSMHDIRALINRKKDQHAPPE